MSPRRTSNVSTATQSAQNRKALRQQPKAYTPGATPRKEAKVLDAGMRVEADLVKLINSKRVGVVCWRRPGIRVARATTGENYLPDAAGYVDELAGLVPDLTPQVKGRLTYNVIFECKGQTSTGSASKKIGQAIIDLAHVSDATGAVGAVIMHTPALTEHQIEYYKNLGRQHSVVVLTEGELGNGHLIAEVVRVARERRRLMRRIGARGGYIATKRPSITEHGLAERVRTRRLNGKVLRRYGAQTTVR